MKTTLLANLEALAKQRSVKGIATWLLIAIAGPAFYGCGSRASAVPPGGSNPTGPAITTISPNRSVAGSAAFTLTVSGKNFVTASTVSFGLTELATTFVSSDVLTALVPATAVASTGSVAVTVTNPAPDGGTSNAANFNLTNGPNPIPTITSIDTTCAPVGAQSFTLEVNGSNFVSSSVLQWNGSDLPTTVHSGGYLEAQIPGNDLAAPGTASITVFTPPGGTSNALSLVISSGDVDPQSVAVDPSGKFIYVANYGGCFSQGYVSIYTTNSTGMLASMGPPLAAGDIGSRAVAVDPSGKFAYVVNDDGGDAGCGASVSMFTIDTTTGALTPIGLIYEDVCAEAIAIHPSGKFAYVTLCSGDIAMYSIDGATGVLTSLGPIAVGSYPSSLAVDPAGKFLYVTAETASYAPPNIFIYSVNPTSGILTSVGNVATGATSSSLAVDPMDRFVYVASYDSNYASMYSINSNTGNLTSIGTIDAGSGPISVAVDPTGQFVYVANAGSNNVSMYSINGATGVLTPIGMVAAGTSPSSIAIAPSGKFAYVANSRSNTVSIYSIDTATGVLALIGTIGT